ncbi:MAG: sigma-54 dependent transcriptional regulator [Pseudomonadota bacterium]
MKDRAHILIIDDDEAILDACSQALRRRNHMVSTSKSGQEGLDLVSAELFHAVLLDLKLPGMDGMEVLRIIKAQYPEIPVIIITGHATIESAVEAIKEGAFDYLSKPFTPQELRQTLRRALRNREIVLENIYLKKELEAKTESGMVVGKGGAMREIMSLLEKVSPSDSTVLITGESGTGKELLAREIHKRSGRSGAPFVVVDCGALVASLFESELFGHTKGSFTGAYETKHGRFEIADGGTIFFDEIGNIEPGIQAKLLRAIQEKEITRVGSSRTMKVDVRIVAATNEKLEDRVREGKFREDLYYRLSVVPIVIPPLRERIEDIPELVGHFLGKFNRRMKKQIIGLSPQVEKALMRYKWPGNIRELENTIERAVVLSQDNSVRIDDVMILGPCITLERPAGQDRAAAQKTLEDVEKEHIRRVLDSVGNHRSRAAEILEVDRKTLWAKIKKYGFD